MQFEASLKVVGSTPQEAVQKLNRICGAYSVTCSQAELGGYDPNILDTNMPTADQVFKIMFDELEQKNPTVTLDEIYEMTKREFYRQYGHIPSRRGLDAFRKAFHPARTRSKGRIAGVR